MFETLVIRESELFENSLVTSAIQWNISSLHTVLYLDELGICRHGRRQTCQVILGSVMITGP